MIYSDLRNNNGMEIKGNIADVTAECILVMREIFLRNEKQYGTQIAKSLLTNMVVKAILPDTTKEEIADK